MGYWIEETNQWEDDWSIVIQEKLICSNCGYTQSRTNIPGGTGFIGKVKFCPNCGEKMENG